MSENKPKKEENPFPMLVSYKIKLYIFIYKDFTIDEMVFFLLKINLCHVFIIIIKLDDVVSSVGQHFHGNIFMPPQWRSFVSTRRKPISQLDDLCSSTNKKLMDIVVIF